MTSGDCWLRIVRHSGATRIKPPPAHGPPQTAGDLGGFDLGVALDQPTWTFLNDRGW
jgi:hypothetical protein